MNTSQLVGCNGVGCVVGAETLGNAAAGVWVKTRFYREGNFLCATVYSVAAGEPKIIELRVDLRPIARAIMAGHAALHQKQVVESSVRGTPMVGWSLGKMWKKAKSTAKKIGRTKLVKGVVKVSKAVAKGAKTVIKSKITGGILTALSVFPLTAPFGAAALGAYAAANAAISGVEAGKKAAKTARAAASTIKAGINLAQKVSSTQKATAAVVKTAGASMSTAQKKAAVARTQAAGKLKLTAQGQAAISSKLAQVPAAQRAAAAKSVAAKLKTLATLRSRAALAKSLPATAGGAVVATTQLQLRAAPAMAKAAATAKTFQNAAVQKRMLEIQARGETATSLLQGVADRAQTGELDAQKSAAIVNLVARNRARIQAMSQANAGGLPGVLITPQGKLVRGRFRIQANANGRAVLYQGRDVPVDTGAFVNVSGWGPTRMNAGDSSLMVGRAPSGCYAIGSLGTIESIAVQGGYGNTYRDDPEVNGELPMDGVRLQAPGPAAQDIGPYSIGAYGAAAYPIGCDCPL